MMEVKEDYPPPAYDLHTFNVSSVQLAPNEVAQSKEVLREKNAERHGPLSTSSLGAFMHVLKGSLGSGLMAIPEAFHNVGLVGGLIGTTLITVICTHCTSILVRCSQELCYRQGKSAMSYADTVEAAFLVGASGRFRQWSLFMRRMAGFFMFLTYYGVNTSYVIFMGQTAKQVLESHVDWSMHIRWYILLLLVVLLPVGIVRHIKFLVPFSAAANVLLLVGFSLTMYFCCIDMPSPSTRPLFNNDVSRWPLFFSTALFAMEGIGTVMPVENVMRKPSDFLGCPSVLNISMVLIWILYNVVGALGYIRFGDDIEGSVTLNLSHDWLSQLVKVSVATAILFTYPLQLTASMEVVWGGVSKSIPEKNQDKWYYIIRALLIIGTVTVGVSIPTLGPVISLFGAIGFSGLGILVPSLTELVTYWKPCPLGFVKYAVLLVVYLFATIAGSFTSVQEIIREQQKH